MTDVSEIVGLIIAEDFSYELANDLKVSKILQILSAMLLRKAQFIKHLRKHDLQNLKNHHCNQLILFNFKPDSTEQRIEIRY